jgi:hypothetical protein
MRRTCGEAAEKCTSQFWQVLLPRLQAAPPLGDQVQAPRCGKERTFFTLWGVTQKQPQQQPQQQQHQH